MGSRGSVIPYLEQQNKEISITDPNMIDLISHSKKALIWFLGSEN